MLNGELRSKVDQVWNAFWAGGIANPLEVIEQITYLLFMRGLDDIQTREENKANTLGRPLERVIFPKGVYRKDRHGKDVTYEQLRWSRLKNADPARMFELTAEHVFTFLREMGEDGTAHAEHMSGARFTIPTPGLLARVVDMLAEIPLEDRDTKGDLYEYMLSKIASAGQNGQFRTPRHIIRLMVELTAPTPNDTICDPASGTCGFLVVAGEYLRDNHKGLFRDTELNKHFHNSMFHGYDFDQTMLRIGSMNMQLHGVEAADIRYRDSLAQEHGDDAGAYSLILANPPFSGSLDYETTAADLLSIVKTKKTELLFMALFLKLLKPGGRAAVIVPSGILENDGSAFEKIRRNLVENFEICAIISLPHSTFKPYASVATSIIIFKNTGRTKNVLFFKIENDGFGSGADRREIPGSEIPSVIEQFKAHQLGNNIDKTKKTRSVDVDEIVGSRYDLSPAFYLSGYEYPKNVQTAAIGELFDVAIGNLPASQEEMGEFPFITSGSEIKKSEVFAWTGPAIVIPTVSSTGHGHASIKNIHYVEGKFSAATITAVLTPKRGVEILVKYVYYFLITHKDEVLVPQMRGATNVTLSLDRLKRIQVPVFNGKEEQASRIEALEIESQEIQRYETLRSAHQATFTQLLTKFRSEI